jgi:hypothetical protein
MLQGAADGTLPAVQLQQLLDNLLQRELQPLVQAQAGQQVQLAGDGQQFLVGRALRVGTQLREVATPQQRSALLQAASNAGGWVGVCVYVTMRLGKQQGRHCRELLRMTLAATRQ